MPKMPNSKLKLTPPVSDGLTDSELKESHFRKKYGEGLPSLRSFGRTNTRFVTYGKGKRFFNVRYVCFGCDLLMTTEGWAYRINTGVAYICPKCKILIANLAEVDVLNISVQGERFGKK